MFRATGPATTSYWLDLPVEITLMAAFNTKVELTGPSSGEMLRAFRGFFADTDQLVGRFATDTDLLEQDFGGRDAVISRYRARIAARTDAVARMGRFVRYVQAFATNLARRDAAEQAALVEVGHTLLDATRGFSAEVTFGEVLHLVPPLLRTLVANAATLHGNGLTPDKLAEGQALFAECKGDGAAARNDLMEQVQLTAAAQQRLERVVAFLVEWASRRAVIEEATGERPLGFDLSEAEQWIATRPAAIAERAAQAAKAPKAQNTAIDTSALVGDALAAFKKQTPGS